MEPSRKSAIVIGAGAAGVRMARLLSDKGMKVMLLEGSNRVGGRMKNIDFHGE